MKHKKTNRLLAILLVICLCATLIPGLGTTASAAEPEYEDIGSAPLQDGAWLQDEIKQHEGNPIVIVLEKGIIPVSAPIKIPADKEVIIRGAGPETILQAEKGNQWESLNSGIFEVPIGAKFSLEDAVIDGYKQTRGIFMHSDAKVTLKNVTIENGNAYGASYAGGAVHVSASAQEDPENTRLSVLEGCVFKNNEASTLGFTGGGAIYVGSGSNVTLRGTAEHPIQFYGNEAHSGGCIYSFESFVLAEHCEFGVGKDQGNKAGQRGGAIHSHGTVVLKDCTVAHNTSGQYGGGIYISANTDYDGLVLLDNTTVTENQSEAGGGGVFLASNATLYLRGKTSIIDNRFQSNALGYSEKDGKNKSNVYYTGATGMIVVCDDQFGAVGVRKTGGRFFCLDRFIEIC